ncbi:hypothetical protein [Nitrosopumilus cobalaminigenes]|uniref:hypothetical protein n=1 Tax=Nitrosopumilus cobalaminigenes TaxID=1470066 RepID=UPI0015CCE789|nr:hypothetical protein [Nitrosopumilus cobalaminigenes]
MELGDISASRKYIHDIIYHQGNFENQIVDLSKEQIIIILCNVTKTFYFDEN